MWRYSVVGGGDNRLVDYDHDGGGGGGRIDVASLMIISGIRISFLIIYISKRKRENEWKKLSSFK